LVEIKVIRAILSSVSPLDLLKKNGKSNEGIINSWYLRERL